MGIEMDSAMSLEQVISDFHAAVVQGAPDSLARSVQPSRDAEPSDAVAVYQNNWRQTLLATLRKQFPVAEQVVGEDCFTQLALRYVLAQPPSHWDLDGYGDGFADYLAAQPSVVAATPYLPDLCRLEYAMQCSYYAADRTGVDGAALEQVSLEEQGRVVFQLASDVRLLTLAYGVDALWAQHQGDQNPDTLMCKQGVVRLIVHRPAFQPQLESLALGEFCILQGIDQHCTMNDLMAIDGADPDCLPACIQKGWIDGFRITKG